MPFLLSRREESPAEEACVEFVLGIRIVVALNPLDEVLVLRAIFCHIGQIRFCARRIGHHRVEVGACRRIGIKSRRITQLREGSG